MNTPSSEIASDLKPQPPSLNRRTSPGRLSGVLGSFETTGLGAGTLGAAGAGAGILVATAGAGLRGAGIVGRTLVSRSSRAASPKPVTNTSRLIVPPGTRSGAKRRAETTAA